MDLNKNYSLMGDLQLYNNSIEIFNEYKTMIFSLEKAYKVRL